MIGGLTLLGPLVKPIERVARSLGGNHVALLLVEIDRTRHGLLGILRPPEQAKNVGQIGQCVGMKVEPLCPVCELDCLARKLLGLSGLSACRQDPGLG